MKKSTNKILTTHTGSLPRPEDLQHLLEAQDRGEQIDRAAFEARVLDSTTNLLNTLNWSRNAWNAMLP
jgi:5-methyltetrahydropteroyltriglutamate--homocysteine methyltransferase